MNLNTYLNQQMNQPVNEVRNFVENEIVSLRKGDCMKIMQQQKDKSIDCIITSPPYNLGGDFHICNKGKRTTYGSYGVCKDNMNEEEYQKSQIEFLNECYRILKNEGVMFYIHKFRIVKGNLITPNEWIYKTPFIVSQIVILDFSATANVDKRRFFPVYETLYILKKDANVKLNNFNCYTDVWKVGKVKRKESGHPATFHIEIPRRCIEVATKEGDIVLDPYMGTGTTGLASIALKRKFIGIEVDEKYFQIAKSRIENTQYELPLFKE
jgi:modification methylase